MRVALSSVDMPSPLDSRRTPSSSPSPTHQRLPPVLQVRHLRCHRHAQQLVAQALGRDHEVEQRHLRGALGGSGIGDEGLMRGQELASLSPLPCARA